MVYNKQYSKIKKCLHCKVKLSRKNMFPSWFKDKIYLCQKCAIKQQMKYYKNGGKERNLIKSRTNYVGTSKNGKQVTLIGNKRPYPKNSKCELCNNKVKVLNYHHWNDNDLSKGMWLCSREHVYANGIETYLQNIEFRNKYLQLKKDIVNGKA